MSNVSARRGGGAAWMLRTFAIVVALSAAALTTARAADAAENVERNAPTLEVDALLYGWIPGTFGSVRVKDTTVQVDSTPADVLRLVFDGDALAGAGYFALSYDRLGIFADVIGGDAKLSVSQSIPTQLCCTLDVDAKSKMYFVILDTGLGYEVARLPLPGRQRPLTLGVWAGARYVYLSNDLEADADVVHGARRHADVYESLDWADPLIGIRWSVPLHDAISLDFRGDIGGFGASSDLTWGLVSMLRLWLPWKPFDLSPYLAAGYRVVAFDRSPDGRTVDMQLRGPVMGAGATF